MGLPILNIGNMQITLPIVQGGMAIRISTAPLAGAVAREGGLGVIAGTLMSKEELTKEIGEAKKIANGSGKIGVNILFAVTNFIELVEVSIKAGIDCIIYGAGFSKDIFKIGEKFDCPIIPIVSSARLAKTSEKLGAAAVVVEGYEAGGHLGTDRSIKELIPEVKEVISIPIIGAGGVTTGGDMYELMKLGADAVQIGTRFAASFESNASEEFKKVYLSSIEGDSVIIESPVGLPGRAVKTTFSEAVISGKEIKVEKCNNCLKRCSHSFCLKTSLENARMGIIETGLVFAGKNVHMINEILTVKEIINNLKREFEEISLKQGRLWNE